MVKAMRQMVAAAACAALLGGCTSYRTSQTVYEVGGYTFVSGLAVGAVTLAMAATAQSSGDLLLGGAYATVFLVPAGLVLGAAGLIGMAVHDEPPEQPVRAPAPERWRPDTPTTSVDDGGAAVHRRAVDLTHEAVTASHAGDCATVRRLGASVRALDLEVYTSAFATEPDLQRCLAEGAPVTTPVENKP